MALVVLGVVVSLGVAACDRPPAPPPAPPRPNIVFILVDTLRADRLASYGDPNGSSPVMDGLAREGVLFKRAIAPAPWTLPSVPSILTGTYPSVHRVINARNLPGASDDAPTVVRALPEQLTTLAEALQAAGYQTAAFSANPFVMAQYGFGQGFDHFDDTFAANNAPGALVTRAALAWLTQRNPTRPFFLYLHYMDVHAPYYAAEKYIAPRLAAVERLPSKHRLPDNTYGLPPLSQPYLDDPRYEQLKDYAEYWQACYDAGVPQVDEHLGVLRNGLQGLRVWDNACVVFIADHGEALGEHIGWGHGDAVYQTELHVPLVLRWPGRFAAGTRITPAVSLVDLMPTMLELLQLPIPRQVQGRSLCGLLRGETATPADLMVEGVKRRPDVQALVRWPWKLISVGDEGRVELYNLADDWAETKDLAAEQGDIVAELKAALAEQAARNQLLAKGVRSDRVPVSTEDLERLRALGYVLDESSQPAAEAPRP